MFEKTEKILKSQVERIYQNSICVLGVSLVQQVRGKTIEPKIKQVGRDHTLYKLVPNIDLNPKKSSYPETKQPSKHNKSYNLFTVLHLSSTC